MYQTLHSKLIQAMEAEGIHALLVVDPENLGYLSGALLPYLRHAPDRAALAVFSARTRALYLPPDLAQAARDQSLAPGVVCVEVPETGPGLAPLLKALLRDQFGGQGLTLGLDLDEISALDAEAVGRAFPACRLVDAGPLLRDRRLLKEPEEIAHIEMACRQADTGIIGAINHMEGAHVGGAYREGCYTVGEFVERTRVHAIEGGTSLSGQMAAIFGPDQPLYRSQQGFLPRAGLVRLDYNCNHAGYWSVNSRTLSMGRPAEAELAACAALTRLKTTALARLRPGTPCAALFAEVMEEATRQGFALWAENGIGHGVGRSEREAPYLCADSKEILRQGMVVALDIPLRGPQGELIRSVDIYAIEDEAPRHLSWFRNWDKPYAVTGFRSAH